MSFQIIIASAAACIGAACGIGTVVVIGGNRNRREQPLRAKTTFVFSGNLKQTSLLDAVQFLELGGREGILHIYCGRRKGYLTFIKGKIVDAFYRNITGREAIFQMLDLEEGDFYFEPKPINQPRLMADSIMDIAFEWDARKSGGAADDTAFPAGTDATPDDEQSPQ